MNCSHLTSGEDIKTTKPIYHPELISLLMEHQVQFKVIEPDNNSTLNFFLSFLPFLLLIGLMIYFMRQMQGGNKGAMNFGRSKARLLSETGEKITFDDVAGIEEAKEEVEEIVEFLKDPRKFQRLGGKIPKGALLVGAPGTGKASLAKAIARALGKEFLRISVGGISRASEIKGTPRAALGATPGKVIHQEVRGGT